jgi:hypothetical protein
VDITKETTDLFAKEAELFERWALDGKSTGAKAVREGIERLMRLYLAALELGFQVNGEVPDEMGVDDNEWKAVYKACSRIPIDYYGEAFDPMIVPPEEPVIGSLADDIADIYRDVMPGLRAYRAGLWKEACGSWGFKFSVHWGEHATGAIRVMDCWFRKTWRSTD